MLIRDTADVPSPRSRGAECLRTNIATDRVHARPHLSPDRVRAELRAAAGLLPRFGGQVGRRMARCLRHARVAWRAWRALRDASRVEALDSLRAAQLHLNQFHWWMAQDPARVLAARWSLEH